MGAAWRVPRTTEACLVWLASALPFLIEPFFTAGRFAGVSRAALAALPWIAWVGLPRARESSQKSDSGLLDPTMTPSVSASARNEAGPLSGALFDVAVCLPPIALGSWIDLESGVARNDVALVAIGSAAFVFALSLAARTARGSHVAQRNHALAWIALVAGLPLLRAALELGGEPTFGTLPGWMSWLARASPLAWIVSCLDASSSAPVVGAVLMTIVLMVVAWVSIDRSGALGRNTP